MAEVEKYNSSPIKTCKKELVLYIGGFPNDHHHDPAFDKELLDFFNNGVGGCTHVETGLKSGGQGAAIFDTQELVSCAIEKLNGSLFYGHKLELSAWKKFGSKVNYLVQSA